MYSVCFKKDLAKRFHPSKFDIQYSIFCGSLFRPASKAASGGADTRHLKPIVCDIELSACLLPFEATFPERRLEKK
jgi:hypothetical protein